MRFPWMGLSPLALICFFSLACSSGQKQQPQAPTASARPVVQPQVQRVDNSQQLAAMQAEIAARDAKIRELEAAHAAQPTAQSAAADPQIAGLASTYDKAKRELTVTLQSDVLFAPGSADLKPEAKATLDKVVAAVKKDYPSKKIRIQGHTDKDPIVRSTDKWIDNMDLSQNRAGAVARYLLIKGVDMKNVVTVGFGESKPKATKAL